MFNKQCAQNYSPDDFLAKDEMLYPSRGSIGFSTYNKDKPAKYGLNLPSLGNAKKPMFTTPFLRVGNQN